MQPTRCQMLAFTKTAFFFIHPEQPHPPASPLSQSSCNDFSLVYRPVQAGPRFATPHLFATPCIRTSSQSIPSWRNPFHAKRPPVDCYKPSALWPAIVNFTYSQALSAPLSYSVPSQLIPVSGCVPTPPVLSLSLPVSFILPALHRYIVPFPRRIISFLPFLFTCSRTSHTRSLYQSLGRSFLSLPEAVQ
jgi:hypothetical protein